ncbi:protease HtpX [Buchnera aphidicola (Ceratoglyphina bambusae)]|uniref:protease HtpX n=1 Tax=Buchnera aphidicola TaxID=9 RepID=UPI0031B83ED5
MKRISLFLLTNISIMFLFSIILNVIGIEKNNLYNLIILSGIIGFSGSIISLIFSKWISLYSVGGKIIKNPNKKIEIWILKTIKKQSKKIGINVPEIAIYLSDNINAFATGRSSKHSLIAISTGLIEKMKKLEIEAVLAHEITHIKNGDMITMILIQGIINTFVIFFSKIILKILSCLFYDEKENSYDSKKGTLFFFIISFLLEFLFGFFANIIIMWFSRKREFYADAGAAKIVGKSKIISALKRLKESNEPNEPKNVSSLCINGKKKKFLEIFMSHPTLKKRIQALYNNEYL